MLDSAFDAVDSMHSMTLEALQAPIFRGLWEGSSIMMCRVSGEDCIVKIPLGIVTMYSVLGGERFRLRLCM